MSVSRHRWSYFWKCVWYCASPDPSPAHCSWLKCLQWHKRKPNEWKNRKKERNSERKRKKRGFWKKVVWKMQEYAQQKKTEFSLLLACKMEIVNALYSGHQIRPSWTKGKEIRHLLCTFSYRDFRLLLLTACVGLCACVYLNFIRTVTCLIRIGRLPFEEHRCPIELYGLHGMRRRLGHCKWNWCFNTNAVWVSVYVYLYVCACVYVQVQLVWAPSDPC